MPSLLSIGELVAHLMRPLAILLALAFAAKLMRRGLYIYWAVAAYFAASALQEAVMFSRYQYEPVGSVPFVTLKLITAAIIAWQMGQRAFASYPALASFATKALRVLFPLCVVVALASYYVDPPMQENRHPMLQLTIAVERAIMAGILLFMLAVGAFAGWFPVQMKQNSVRLLIGFLVLLTCDWIALLVTNAKQDWTGWMNVLGVLAQCEAAVYWLITVSLAGETAMAPMTVPWSPQRMSKLTLQLDEIHSHLARKGF
ncbi:MAG: hypothetical protein WDO18_23360 [Acidobacteriota bacterium]